MIKWNTLQVSIVPPSDTRCNRNLVDQGRYFREYLGQSASDHGCPSIRRSKNLDTRGQICLEMITKEWVLSKSAHDECGLDWTLRYPDLLQRKVENLIQHR
jgi:hypothetical protein